MTITFYRFEFKQAHGHQQRLVVNIAAKDFSEACKKAETLHPGREVLVAAYMGQVEGVEAA